MTQAKTRWRRAAIVAGTIVAIAVWRYEARSRSEFAQPVKATGVSTVRVDSGSTDASTPVSATEPGPAERALDIAALRKNLAGRPDGEAEIARIVAFARFRDRASTFGERKDRMSAAERARSAREILAELPEHVARNEILPVQAQALTAALLIDAQPDPAARQSALETASRQWDAYSRSTVGPSPERDPRFQDYARQSRDIVRQVQSSVPDPRQQQIVIAERLQALRVQLYDHVSSPDAH